MAPRERPRKHLPPTPVTYETRYRFTPPVCFLVPCAIALALFLAWSAITGWQTGYPALDEGSGWVAAFWAIEAVFVLLAVWMGGLGLTLLAAGLLRPVALRVDRSGVMLRRLWFPPRRAVVVPWTSLTAVVIFDKETRREGIVLSFRYVGLRFRAGVERPRGVARPGTVMARLRALNYWYETQHLRQNWPETVEKVLGWRLDEARLRRAMRANAPDVLLERGLDSL